MYNVARWALIIGFLMPLLVAVIEQPKWPDWVRAVVAAILCIIAGGMQVYVMGQFNAADLTTSILIILVEAIAVYQAFWKKVGIKTLENATTIGQGQATIRD